MKITILTEEELRKCVKMDETALEAIAQGFSKLVEGKVSFPPIMRVDIQETRTSI